MVKQLKVIVMLGVLFGLIGCTDDPTAHAGEAETKIEKRQDEFPGFDFMSPCEALNITIFVSLTCQGTPHDEGVDAAIEAFNNTPSGVRMTRVNTENADIVINCVDGKVCGEGRAKWNDSSDFSTTGSLIELDVDWESCPCTDPSQINCNFVDNEPQCMFNRLAMHELAHALGVAHNGEGNHIAGTPDTDDDPNSVFNAGHVTNENCDWCDAPCVFNEGDILALQALYPQCACEENINIIFPTVFESKGCFPAGQFVKVCAYGWGGDAVPIDASYTWSSTGSVVIESDVTTSEHCTYISVGETGGTVSVWADSEGCGTHSINRTIEICQVEPGGGGFPGPGKDKPIQ